MKHALIVQCNYFEQLVSFYNWNLINLKKIDDIFFQNITRLVYIRAILLVKIVYSDTQKKHTHHGKTQNLILHFYQSYTIICKFIIVCHSYNRHTSTFDP